METSQYILKKIIEKKVKMLIAHRKADNDLKNKRVSQC
jgi:hypothetical protein